MKKITKSAGIVLVTMLVLSACSSNSANPPENGSPGAGGNQGQTTNDPDSSAASKDPYGAYEQQVALSIAKDTIPNNNLPEGDTLENNEYTRYLEKKLNVKVTHAWESQPGDAYSQKVGVTIASNDLPDAMIVNLEQMNQLVKADAIADLTEVYEQYASPLVKDIFGSYNGRLLGMSTYGGKLMGLPSTDIGYQHNLLWLRKDWLDKLDLQPPKSLDDLIAVAKAFIEKDPDGNNKADTFGIMGDPNMAPLANTVHGFDTIFGSMHSYPGVWVKGGDGSVSYGSIAPETKTALAKLQEMYKQGVIDSQFAVRKADDANAQIAAGKTGLVFGPWWIPYWPLNDSVKNDPKAEWVAYNTPLDDSGKLNVVATAPASKFLVVRKGYQNPEAVMKVLNVQSAAIRHADPIEQDTKDIYKDKIVNWANWPFGIQVDYDDAVMRSNTHLRAALEAKSPASLTVEEVVGYNNILANEADPKKNIDAWADATAKLLGPAPLQEDSTNVITPGFYGTTKTMKSKWSVLQKMEKQTFLKIIVGESPVSAFDDFVTKWKTLGGDQITQEVNEAAKQ
ncbi:extracellular solute-binding protein [Paenibacillus sp. GCM10027626]|uniref:extracellular solute-binding protein n=1 Tax=Paenibacillus sp. GCM10027626 TaxID=3273411 RepID=UPI00362551AE